MKILYHGTDKKFKNFNFSFAKPNKDFGKGFYLTSDLKQAIEWANIKNHSNHFDQPTANFKELVIELENNNVKHINFSKNTNSDL